MKIFDLYKRFQKQISNLSIYFLAALIPMALSLISNPFLAKNLSPEDYAIIGYYSAFVTLFSPLINFYLLHFYTKRFYELDSEGRNTLKATLYRALIFFSLILTIAAVILLCGYKLLINEDSQIPLMPYVVLSMLPVPITGIYTLSLTECRMKRESKRFFSISVTNGFLGMGLALLLVVAFKFGAIGRLSATLLTAIIMFVYTLVKNREIWKYPFDKDIFWTALKFCWPLVLASMLTFFCTGYDKIMLERLGDLRTLGIYSVGVTIAGYLSLFSSSINDTFQPDIYESIVKRNFNRCVKYVLMKLSIMSVCVILFAVFAPFIINILTYGRYIESAPYAIIVAISSITSMMYYSMSQVTVAMGYTKITLVNKILGSVVSILSFGFLINTFGAIGAAWGVVLSYMYFFTGNAVLVYYNYKKNHKK